MNIVIKLPNDLNERVLTFPFLHMVEKYFKSQLKEDEVLNMHLISLKEGLDILNLLPFKAFYHELDKGDLKTVFSVHRACMNFKIDKVDCFISTTNSFVDASIGKNISAQRKVGFAHGKNGWLLTDKVTKLSGRHFVEQIFELLRPIITEDFPEIPNTFSRELPPCYADWSESPYIVIDLDLEGEFINPEWIDLFDLFVNKNFVFLCSQEKIDLQKSTLNEFVRKLPNKNTYKVFEHQSHIEFGKLISHCKYFVSYDSHLVNLAAYCGSSIIHLNQKMDIQNYGTQFFVGELRNFSLSDPSFKQGKTFNYTKIFDLLYDIIEGTPEEEDSEEVEEEVKND